MVQSEKKAIIYCRVSTREQVEEGNSLVTQEKLCREYALKHGYDIAKVFIEQGESAKTTQRPELTNLLNFCAFKKNQIQVVITYKIDRISRNTDDYSQIRILLKRHGVEIKSTSEHFTNDPAGRFMENIIANVAQFDNDVRTERCVNGMKDAMRDGRYVWGAPLGYSNIRINGKATISPNAIAPLITETFDKVAQNTTTTEAVRQEMSAKGLVMSSGKYVSKAQFYRMLRNRVYAGWIIKFGESHKGLFEPLVSDELFDQVQLVLKYKRHRNYTYQVKHPDFPLRRFVFHPSGRRLTGSWSKGKSKYYPYYFFKSEKLVVQKDRLEKMFVTFLNRHMLTENHFKLLVNQTEEHLVKENKCAFDRSTELRKTISDLKIKQTALVQKNIKGVISDHILKDQLELVDQELVRVQSSLARLPDNIIKYNDLLKPLKEFLLMPGQTWLKASLDKRLLLQWFYFPKGVLFNGQEIQTQEICKIFKAKNLFLTPKSHEVDFMHQKTNTLDIPISDNNEGNKDFWEGVGEEIIFLSNLNRESTAPG